MDELRAAAGFIPRSLATLAGLLSGLVLVIWALTGQHHFWPMWVWLGAGLSLTLLALIRNVHARGGRWPDQLWAIFLLLTGWQVVIWLMTGLEGSFWPVWDLLAAALLIAVRMTVWPRRERGLEERVEVLTRSRSGVLDVQASELRRIERDLHDGAQSRLVALSMQIGRAEARLRGHVDDDTVALLTQAREEAAAAIGELRDLARGIAPPVLADRGLEAAVNALADRSSNSIPVSVNADLPGRLPPAVETAAYFVVAEALTNAVKHAAASSMRVSAWTQDGELGLVVADDGVGGADPHGSGLDGLSHRVEAVDGWLVVESPVGEGTTIRVGLPCG